MPYRALPLYCVLEWSLAGGKYTTMRTYVHNGERSVPLRDLELLLGTISGDPRRR